MPQLKFIHRGTLQWTASRWDLLRLVWTNRHARHNQPTSPFEVPEHYRAFIRSRGRWAQALTLARAWLRHCPAHRLPPGHYYRFFGQAHTWPVRANITSTCSSGNVRCYLPGGNPTCELDPSLETTSSYSGLYRAFNNQRHKRGLNNRTSCGLEVNEASEKV
jgi:hypothetical protein